MAASSALNSALTLIIHQGERINTIVPVDEPIAFEKLFVPFYDDKNGPSKDNGMVVYRSLEQYYRPLCSTLNYLWLVRCVDWQIRYGSEGSPAWSWRYSADNDGYSKLGKFEDEQHIWLEHSGRHTYSISKNRHASITVLPISRAMDVSGYKVPERIDDIPYGALRRVANEQPAG